MLSLIKLHYLCSALIKTVSRRTAWIMKLPKASKGQAYLLYDVRTCSHYIQACLHKRLPLVVMTQCIHNGHSSVTAKQAPSSVLLNDLVTLTVPLLRNTASIFTFENTEHLRLILLVFCQQVAMRKHASCSRSSLKSMEKVSSTFFPAQNWKLVCTTFLWQPRRRHFTLANQISNTKFHTFQRNQSDFSISVKLQNNFTLFNGTFIQTTL